MTHTKKGTKQKAKYYLEFFTWDGGRWSTSPLYQTSRMTNYYLHLNPNGVFKSEG